MCGVRSMELLHRWRFFGFGQNKAAAGRIEVEQLSVATPVDGGFKLALGFVLAELLVKHVQEEFFRNGVVTFVVEGACDLPEKQNVFGCGLTEDFLLPENFRFSVLPTSRCDDGIALLDPQEAEQNSGVDN